MNTYTHRQGLFSLPAAMALPALIASDAIDWNSNAKVFTGTRHYNNWLRGLANKYDHDEVEFRGWIQDAVDNGYFEVVPVEKGNPAFIFRRSLPGGRA